jgi:hypothetical protein
MKANTNNAEVFGDDPTLAEPHFDDEKTLLTAQPVVPLNEIRAAERLGKQRTLGIAIFCSLVVGFVSASLVYKHRNQKTAGEIVSSAIVPGAAGEGNDGAASTSAPPDSGLNAGVASLPQAEPSPPQSDSQLTISSEVSPRNKPVAKTEVLRKPRRIAPAVVRSNQEPREIEHTAHDRKRRNEDAWRIREIFEGSRRP